MSTKFALYSLSLADSDGSVSSSQRVVLSNMFDCLGLTTKDDGNSYFLLRPSMNKKQVTLVFVDFSGYTYKTETATAFDWEISKVSGTFLSSGPDFYAAGTFSQPLYKSANGLVITSLSSRRPSALMSGVWSADTDWSGSACSGTSCVDSATSPVMQSSTVYFHNPSHSPH